MVSLPDMHPVAASWSACPDVVIRVANGSCYRGYLFVCCRAGIARYRVQWHWMCISRSLVVDRILVFLQLPQHRAAWDVSKSRWKQTQQIPAFRPHGAFCCITVSNRSFRVERTAFDARRRILNRALHRGYTLHNPHPGIVDVASDRRGDGVQVRICRLEKLERHDARDAFVDQSYRTEQLFHGTGGR